MNNDHVDITYEGQVHRVASGIRVDDFLRDLDGEIPDTVLSALVNRRQVMLDFPLRGEVELDLVRYGPMPSLLCVHVHVLDQQGSDR